MRALSARSIAFREAGIAQFFRWLQAGFSSFAYRLAHLTLSRALIVCVLGSLLYLS